jgi:hypothetical protein
MQRQCCNAAAAAAYSARTNVFQQVAVANEHSIDATAMQHSIV